MESYLKTLKQFNRDTWLFLISTDLIGFSIVGIYVVLFYLYLLLLGYGPAVIGLVNGLAQLGLVFFSLGSGMLGSRFGSRRMLITVLGIAMLGFGLLPLAEGLPGAWQAGWLVVTYILAWLGGALYLVNATPFLMGITGSEERGHVFAVREALFPLAAFAGSLVGGLLPGLLVTLLGGTVEQPAPYRYSLFLAAAIFIPATVALVATREVKVKTVLQQKEQ